MDLLLARFCVLRPVLWTYPFLCPACDVLAVYPPLCFVPICPPCAYQLVPRSCFRQSVVIKKAAEMQHSGWGKQAPTPNQPSQEERARQRQAQQKKRR